MLTTVTGQSQKIYSAELLFSMPSDAVLNGQHPPVRYARGEIRTVQTNARRDTSQPSGRFT